MLCFDIFLNFLPFYFILGGHCGSQAKNASDCLCVFATAIHEDEEMIQNKSFSFPYPHLNRVFVSVCVYVFMCLCVCGYY